jgi:uncharacterized protein YutE (UPF0331/DUF86 family)
MQSKYLWNNKGVIDMETADLIDKAQIFRNKIVHQVGIVEMSESELTDEIFSIDVVISKLSSLNSESLEKLKGVDLRNGQQQEGKI